MSLRDVMESSGCVWDESLATCSSFGNPAAELVSLDSRPAVADLPGRTVVEIQGADRSRFLHNFCTNDIQGLQPGQGCEAFLTTVKGRVLAHLTVQNTGDSLWFDCDAGQASAVLAHLDRYIITEDVTLVDHTEQLRCCLVVPDAAGEWPSLSSAPFLSPPNSLAARENASWNAEFDVDGISGLCSVRPWGKRPVAVLLVPAGRAAEVWQSLLRRNVAPAGADAREAFRIAAGIPRYGVDISDDNLAQEVGRTPQAISFRKGCYLGQEPIARLDAMGHVNRVLRRIRFDGTVALSPGLQLFMPGSEQPVGTLSSCSQLPDDPHPLGLAMLRAQAAAPGQAVSVRPDGHQEAVMGHVEWDE